MIEDEIKKLKRQQVYTRADVVNLVFYCDVLLIRADKNGEELRLALDKIVRLEQRLDFYRSATLPKLNQ